MTGLLGLRNTPGENGLSAAKMVFGQELRSILPSIRASLLKERKKNYYNQHSKTMSDLGIMQRVRIQDEETKRWNRIGTVVKVGNHRRYLVEKKMDESYGVIENSYDWLNDNKYLVRMIGIEEKCNSEEELKSESRFRRTPRK